MFSAQDSCGYGCSVGVSLPRTLLTSIWHIKPLKTVEAGPLNSLGKSADGMSSPGGEETGEGELKTNLSEREHLSFRLAGFNPRNPRFLFSLRTDRHPKSTLSPVCERLIRVENGPGQTSPPTCHRPKIRPENKGIQPFTNRHKPKNPARERLRVHLLCEIVHQSKYPPIH
jgi:hypothetical protein